MKTQALVLAAACGALLVAAPAPSVADTTVEAQLVQQNKSGAGGTVTLTATDGGDLRVRIRATGLVPGPHAQHIHGAAGGGSYMCATERSDEDGDGWLTNEEGSGEYGDVYLALTTSGDTSPASGLDLDRMPIADAQGRLSYDRTIPADQVPRRLLNSLAHVHVVQHGIDANGNGEYDLDALGESTFAKGLGVPGVPAEITNPASCGMVMGAAAGHQPRGGVETGGEPTGGGAAWPMASLGAVLLSLAVALVTRRRRSDPPTAT